MVCKLMYIFLFKICIRHTFEYEGAPGLFMLAFYRKHYDIAVIH